MPEVHIALSTSDTWCHPFAVCVASNAFPTGCALVGINAQCGNIFTSCTGCKKITTCPPGLTHCGVLCVDLTTDPGNCGSCGNACPTGASCQNGSCSCPAGQTACGGMCVNTSSDPNNCGICGMSCPPGINSGTPPTCCGGVCVDISTNPSNCGGCGISCPPGAICCEGCGGTMCSDGIHCCPPGTKCRVIPLFGLRCTSF